MHGALKVGEIGFKFLFAFKDDAGTVIDLTGAPLTDAIRFQRPDDLTEDVDMVIEGAPTLGIASFTVADVAFLNQKGAWHIRGNAAGRLSDPAFFEVDPDLPAPIP